MRRDSGHGVIPDRADPISVTNGSGGYPEIAPGSYVIVSAPINRIGNGWGQVTELDGVSVTIGGESVADLRGVEGRRIRDRFERSQRWTHA